MYKILKLSIDEKGHYQPSKRVWKKVESQRKVRKVGLDMDIEWQPWLRKKNEEKLNNSFAEVNIIGVIVEQKIVHETGSNQIQILEVLLCLIDFSRANLFHKIHRHDTGHFLRVKFPKREDAGFYNCTGRNRDAFNFVVLQLIVECKFYLYSSSSL